MNWIAAQFHILVLKGCHPIKTSRRGREVHFVTIWRTIWRWFRLFGISIVRLMEVHEVASHPKSSWSIIRVPFKLSHGKKRGQIRVVLHLNMNQHSEAMCTSDPLQGYDWASETDHNKCMMHGQQCRGNLVCERQTQSVVQKKAKTNETKKEEKEVDYRSQ